MNNKDRYLNILTSANRAGMSGLVGWLKDTDFFTAPASTRFHECYEGGLVEHHLKVYEQLKHLTLAYSDRFTFDRDSIIIVSLLHDVCKVGCYKVDMRWRKDANNQWEQYPTYKFEEDYAFGGHGSKSVYLIQNFINLKPDEATAINCHMGVENGKWEVFEAFRRNPLAFLLHTADMAATIDYLNKEVEE